MNVKWISYLLFVSLILSGCSYATLEQVIEKDIPFNVKEVIHKEKVRDGIILLYVTEQKDSISTFDALSVAFLKGNHEDGWENVGHNHWEYKRDSRVTVYKDVFYEYDHRGKLLNRIPIIFGEIESVEVQSIVVFGVDNEHEQVHIIETESGRYYIKIGEYEAARGV